MIRVRHEYEHELGLILRGTSVMMPLIMFIEEKEKLAKKEVFDDIMDLARHEHDGFYIWHFSLSDFEKLRVKNNE